MRSWFLNEGTEACDKRRREWLRTGIVPEDYPEPVAADWPDLLEIVERLVKPERATNKEWNRRELWWRHTRTVPGLRAAISGLETVYTTLSQASAYHTVAKLRSDRIFSSNLNVICWESPEAFGLLQARAHEHWVNCFGSTMKDDPVYTVKTCFQTFPFIGTDPQLAAAAEAYHAHRAALMLGRNEGLTKTYNRFHNPSDRAPDVQRLRDLHHELDRAVLLAYGWEDLAARAAPEFLTEDIEPDHRYQGRFFWPAPFRDEVLACLLDLNRARAAEERALGLSPQTSLAEEEEEEALTS